MKRQQLTLFLDPSASNAIEAVRRQYNPEQYALISSHLTLCREDEIEEIDQVIQNCVNLNLGSFHLPLGELVRFSDGKGLYIEVIDQYKGFQELRKAVLRDVVKEPRIHDPHITVMHPRNSTCTDVIHNEILKYELPKRIMINKISLIEQELGKQWYVLDSYSLKN